jgi:hypothetical protein
MSDTDDSRGDAAGRDADDEFDLLSSPLRRVRFGRGFVLAGPIGLAIALVASLWVSTMHVRHSVLVQVERTWIAGEHLGMRVALVATRPGPIQDATVEAEIQQAGRAPHPLPAAGVTANGSIAEVGFEVPPLDPGAATLLVRVRGEGVDPIDEPIAIEVAAARSPVVGDRVVSGSTLQYGDDSEAQPEGLRIVVRPAGRLLAGFDNEIFVRVTDPSGTPVRGAIDVVLVDGEFMGHVGDGDRPPVLFSGTPDALGVVRLYGPLASDVVRLEVRAVGSDGKPRTRRLRMVSFAGAVDVVATPAAVAPGEPLEVKAWGLSDKVPIHVDVHGADGALADVMFPPVVGREPPRPWSVPTNAAEGILQIEAHNHVTAPGESTALARVQVTAMDATTATSLRPLVAAHREVVDAPRIERDYDAALERAFLDWLERAPLTPIEVEGARRLLLGTLPATVYGPPVALVTRPRLEEELAQTQGRARIAMRIFLLGGGALFLGAMAIGMIRSHRRAAAVTLEELRREVDDDPGVQAKLEAQVRQATRAGILRGFAVIGIMVGGIALTMFILERIVWVF